MNPYEQPSSLNDRVSAAARSFRVGVKKIKASCMSRGGRFAHDRDKKGHYVRKRDVESNLGPVAPRAMSIRVGKRRAHQITNAAVDGAGRVNAYVDGQLVEANLFASLRYGSLADLGIFMIVDLVLVLLVGVLLQGLGRARRFWMRGDQNEGRVVGR